MSSSSSTTFKTTRITLHIRFNTIPSERIIFGPQINCRDHYYKPSSPIILDPSIDPPGVVKQTTVEIPNRNIGINDVIIVYLNHKDVIKTYMINDPIGDNVYTMTVS